MCASPGWLLAAGSHRGLREPRVAAGSHRGLCPAQLGSQPHAVQAPHTPMTKAVSVACANMPQTTCQRRRQLAPAPVPHTLMLGGAVHAGSSPFYPCSLPATRLAAAAAAVPTPLNLAVGTARTSATGAILLLSPSPCAASPSSSSLTSSLLLRTLHTCVSDAKHHVILYHHRTHTPAPLARSRTQPAQCTSTSR